MVYCEPQSGFSSRRKDCVLEKPIGQDKKPGEEKLEYKIESEFYETGRRVSVIHNIPDKYICKV